ncbi:MAG: hypothetical protein R2709_01045 [Marmoricola sp.]
MAPSSQSTNADRLDELAEKWRSVSVSSMFGTKRDVVTNVARGGAIYLATNAFCK